MELRKRPGRKQIIVPPVLSEPDGIKPSIKEPLVTALARAFHRQELLDSGRCRSMDFCLGTWPC